MFYGGGVVVDVTFLDGHRMVKYFCISSAMLLFYGCLVVFASVCSKIYRLLPSGKLRDDECLDSRYHMITNTCIIY